MEAKKRKRTESDTSAQLPDIAEKKGKHDLLFPPQQTSLDDEIRSRYLASQNATFVLQAIDRGDANAINAGHAPPELPNRARKRWRDAIRQYVLGNSKSAQQAGHQQKKPAATSDTSVSHVPSTKVNKTDGVAIIKREDIAGRFFSGVASHLDNSTKAAYVSSPAAQDVIDAVVNGKPDSIFSSHAPPGLGKKTRMKWRDEQRSLATRHHSTTSQPRTSVSLESEGRTSSQSNERTSQTRVQRQPLLSGTASSEKPLPVSGGPSGVNAKAGSTGQNIDVKSAGFTKLISPLEKVWDGSAKSTTRPQADDPRQTSSASWKPVSQRSSAGQVSGGVPIPLSNTSAPRRSSNGSSIILGRQRSRESISHVAPRRLPGDRNFDVPDYFTRGTLEDTQRRFEAWARKQRGGQSDSSDSDSDDDSDDNDEELEVSAAAPVRGSFHESWADQISGALTEQPSKTASSNVVEHAFESSDDEGDNDDAEVQTQLSREMDAATPALGETTTDVQCSSFAKASTTEHVEEMATDRESPSEVEPNRVAAGQPTDQSFPDDPKVRASSPQSRPSGTSYGSPNATRQANVRVKRILSPADPGGDPSGLGPADPAKPMSKENVAPEDHLAVPAYSYKDRIDNGELSDDLYAAIDDVTSSVLGTVTSAPAAEGIPSMNECKPSDFNDGQDRNPLITNDASAVATSNLGGHADMMEELENEVQMDEKELKADGKGSLHDGNSESESKNNKQVEEMDKGPSPPSSPHSPLSELSHTPSPPDATPKKLPGRLPGEPQVVVSPYLPGTPEVAGQDSARKTRKMTGRSSKHFGVVKPTKRARKSVQTEEDSTSMATPEVSIAVEQPSSVYETAMSRRTRSAYKEPAVAADEEATTPTQQFLRPPSPARAECSPLSALEEALNAEAPATPSKKRRKTRKSILKDEEAQAASNTNPQEPETSSPQTFITPPEDPSQQPQTPLPKPRSKPKSKSTGKISTHFITDRVDIYNTTASSRRVPAGVSVVPVPSIHAPHFGILQEKLAHQPFWLLIAVTFLNKTAGRSAVPIFWKLKEKYPTPEALAEADPETLLEMVHCLGLQNQRSKRLVKIAGAWRDGEPVRGRRYRTLNYPKIGDGRARDVPDVVEEDAEDCSGALEIGHIPGCGDYAWDSWRAFCRDVLRGVADDYNGLNAKTKDFESEWKRVLPKDKELRACLRWMWLREGWIWDPLTGEKRRATEEEMEKAVQGEMEITDPQERKFAAQAAGVVVSPEKVEVEDVVDETPSKVTNTVPMEEDSEHLSNQSAEDDEGEHHDEGHESDTIIVAPFKTRQGRRRNSNRAARIEPSVEVTDDSPPRPSTRKKAKKEEAEAERKRKSDAEPTPKSGSKRKPKTSTFRDDDDEEFGARKSRRRSKRLTM